MSMPVFLLMGLWLLMLFDPHWLLAAYGPDVVLKIPVFFYLGLLPILALGVPSNPVWKRRWSWIAPVLAFMVIGLLTMPFAENNGYAREGLQQTLLWWIMMVATVALVDSARRTERLLLYYGLAFLWFGLWGARAGLVRWHHVLANQDGFGAFMVLGLGFCSFLAAAAHKGRYRQLMLLAAAVCVVGVVASFARGAFLASAAVFAVVWFRSSRKGMTLLAGIVGVLVVIGAAEIIHPGKFWMEMQSVFHEGTEEGTGEDRWELWMASVEVFKERPLLGVGVNNFGPFAASLIGEGEIGGRYAYNIGGLYNRSLHSIYFTILSEMGIAGCIVFLWMLWDFWRRNKVLRAPESQRYWELLGGRMKLQQVALGLEVAMVGFLAIAAVYSTAGKHWFWTLLALNLLLHRQVQQMAKAVARTRVASVDRRTVAAPIGLPPQPAPGMLVLP